MALFLGVHNMGQAMPDEQMVASWETYKAACDKIGCKSVHAHVNAEQGRAFCITEANSIDEVQAAHDEAKVPLQEIIPVKTIE